MTGQSKHQIKQERTPCAHLLIQNICSYVNQTKIVNLQLFSHELTEPWTRKLMPKVEFLNCFF